MRNLAIGYFNNQDFITTCKGYTKRIREVYFAWPGMLSCRPSLDFTGIRQKRFKDDLRWCRQQGILLDVIFNCNCYGEDAVSEKLKRQVYATFEEMGEDGIFPDIVTTTSPFIATMVKAYDKEISVRASVNMRIHGPRGFDYIKDIFDSYYVNREFQHSFRYMKKCRDWAKQNQKELGMLVNSGCLRDCPYQQFHDNMHGHDRLQQTANAQQLGFEIFLCRQCQKKGNMDGFLNGTWIAPDKVAAYEPYVSVIKLSTRRVANPAAIIQAYATRHYTGNIGNLTDPPFSIENRLDD